jgi:hypothetical protein
MTVNDHQRAFGRLIIRFRNEHELSLPMDLSSRLKHPVTLVGTAGLQTLLRLDLPENLRFKGLFGLQNGRSFRNSASEPVPFVESAQEFGLGIGRIPHHQKKVSVLFLGVQNQHLYLFPDLNVKELSFPVVSDIDREGLISSPASGSRELRPGSDLIKLLSY